MQLEIVFVAEFLQPVDIFIPMCSYDVHLELQFCMLTIPGRAQLHVT